MGILSAQDLVEIVLDLMPDEHDLTSMIHQQFYGTRKCLFIRDGITSEPDTLPDVRETYKAERYLLPIRILVIVLVELFHLLTDFLVIGFVGIFGTPDTTIDEFANLGRYDFLKSRDTVTDVFLIEGIESLLEIGKPFVTGKNPSFGIKLIDEGNDIL